MLLPLKVKKVEADLKKLTKLDGNKLCANCPEKIPGYAEMTHCVFIWLECFVIVIACILYSSHFLSLKVCIGSTNIK